MDENECSNVVIGAAIEVHRHLGPGLLEGACELALWHEFHISEIAEPRMVERLSFFSSASLR